MSHPFDDLTPDFMLDAVDAAGFLSDGRLLQLNSFENRVYQVGQEDGPPVIVKFYRPQRWSDEQILEEHAFSLFLVERDLPVVAPEVRDGNSLFHCEGFAFAVFRRAGGHAPELSNDNHLEQLGRTLARWHACGSDRPYQHRPTLDVLADIRTASTFLVDEVVDLNYRGQYRDLCGQLLERIEQRLDDINPPLLNVHGDCHTGNATTTPISLTWTTACAPRPCRTSGCCCPGTRTSNNTSYGSWRRAMTPSCPFPGNRKT